VPDWTVTTGDCLDPLTGLASLADKSVDHVITDPPYDEKTHGNGRRGNQGVMESRHRIGHTGYDERPSNGATFSRSRELGFDPITTEQMAAVAIECARVATRWVVTFCALEMLSDWRGAFEAGWLEYVRCGIWRKLGATPQFTGDRPGTGAEAVVIAHPPGRKRWNGGGRHGVWEFPIVLDRGHNGARVHTTQKPLALMEALIRDFTDPGDLICDPFCGSGTTGVAALRLGRRFIGWELNEAWAATARKRLGETREQLGLFAAEDSA
jgi:DNA modification methylase